MEEKEMLVAELKVAKSQAGMLAIFLSLTVLAAIVSTIWANQNGFADGMASANTAWQKAAQEAVLKHNTERPMYSFEPDTLTPEQLAAIVAPCHVWDWRERGKCRYMLQN